ncbi:hypothetical protein MC28_0242 [Bacillus thuringiensis MC28]|nr:hypothetical protein MC28_0242 [Bacillus thuringiensis MC28]
MFVILYSLVYYLSYMFLYFKMISSIKNEPPNTIGGFLVWPYEN